MSGTLCLALRMERLYKPVRYVALGRALPHDIWIGTAGAIKPLRRRRRRGRQVSLQDLRVFLHFLHPYSSSGTKKSLGRSSSHASLRSPWPSPRPGTFCRPPKRRGWRGTAAAATAAPFAGTCLTCGTTWNGCEWRMRGECGSVRERAVLIRPMNVRLG